jgi:hypothetical protein
VGFSISGNVCNAMNFGEIRDYLERRGKLGFVYDMVNLIEIGRKRRWE